jgi:hypothetical protein
MADRSGVREAIGRIEPLSGAGPNLWTVDVPSEGGLIWGLSAPTRRQLALMLWHWFQLEEPQQ